MTTSTVPVPLGFAPDGPLVTLKSNEKKPALPLPTAESWNDGDGTAAAAVAGPDRAAARPTAVSTLRTPALLHLRLLETSARCLPEFASMTTSWCLGVRVDRTPVNARRVET